MGKKVNSKGEAIPKWDPRQDSKNSKYEDKYRCNYPMEKWNVIDKEADEEKFIVPYSLHWTVPPCAWETLHKSINELNREMGCLKFVHIKTESAIISSHYLNFPITVRIRVSYNTF